VQEGYAVDPDYDQQYFLSDCTTIEGGCDDYTLQGVVCEPDFAAFSIGVEQCSVDDGGIAMLTGCMEVVHVEIDSTLGMTQEEADTLCQNMADEVEGVIYSCDILQSRRLLAEGGSTLIVQIGVPHLETAMDEVSADGFWEAVLPEGIEPHHIDPQEPQQLVFSDSPTSAPTADMTTISPTEIEMSTTAMIVTEVETIYKVDSWFFKVVIMLTVIVVGMAIFAISTVCGYIGISNNSNVESKQTAFATMEDIEDVKSPSASMSSANLFLREVASIEWLDRKWFASNY
jgi:hypothetical protein